MARSARLLRRSNRTLQRSFLRACLRKHRSRTSERKSAQDKRIMTRRHAALAYSAMAILACTQATRADDHGNVAPRQEYAAIATELRAMIGREMQDKELPAFSIALVDGNQIVWAEGFGFQDADHKIPATAHTVYRVGS